MVVRTPLVDAALRLGWPQVPFDPTRARLHYGAVADELVVCFAPRPVPSVSDPLVEAPDGGDTAILVGLRPDDEETGEVVGIHVYPLLAGAAQTRPSWRTLAGPDPPPAAVARFVAEVKDLFDRYWTPAPPVEEQLARLHEGKIR